MRMAAQTHRFECTTKILYIDIKLLKQQMTKKRVQLSLNTLSQTRTAALRERLLVSHKSVCVPTLHSC